VVRQYLADIIGTHPDIYFACHENKLISEHYGLRDIVDVLRAGPIFCVGILPWLIFMAVRHP
tara:strand:- start:14569 stop:14754 length:186 start_codon:yes stop_codon:yes gene_type:complete